MLPPIMLMIYNIFQLEHEKVPVQNVYTLCLISRSNQHVGERIVSLFAGPHNHTSILINRVMHGLLYIVAYHSTVR